MSDLRFDTDGYVDLDDYDAAPLGFAERRAADRLLREGFAEGLSAGWPDRLFANDPAFARATAGDSTSDAVDVVVLPSGAGAERPRVRATMVRLAVAAAVAVLVVLGAQLLVEDDPSDDFRDAPTTTSPSAESTTTEPTTTSEATSTTATTTITTTTAGPEEPSDTTEVGVVPPASSEPAGTIPPSTSPATTAPPATSTPPPTTAPPTTAPPTTAPPTTAAPPTITLSGPSQIESGQVVTFTASGSGWNEVFWTYGPNCGPVSESGTSIDIQGLSPGQCNVVATARNDGQTVIHEGGSVQDSRLVPVVAAS